MKKSLFVLTSSLLILAACGTTESISSLDVSSSTPSSSSSSTSTLSISDSVTGIEMEGEYESIGVGHTYALNAHVLPETATDQKINYTSSNNSIATVDENGVVTGIADGNVTITAKTNNNGFEKTFEFDVIDYEANFETGSVFGTASKTFTKVSDEKYKIERCDEDDVSYLKLKNHSGDWYFEAKVTALLSNVTIDDINATDGFTCPVGVGGVSDGAAYSFGPVSYQRKTFNKTLYDKNCFDATLTTNKSVGSLTSGSYATYCMDLGGEGSSFLGLAKGYTVGVLKQDNVYYYFVNDIYLGANAYNVENLGEACPALVTYKSGATFSEIKFIPANHAKDIKTKLDKALDSKFNKDMFASPYATPKADTQINKQVNYVIDLEGEMYLTNNAEKIILPTKYIGTNFYLEYSYSLSWHSKYITVGEDLNYSGGAIGVYEAYNTSDTRYMHLGLTNNPKYASSTTNVIEYMTNVGFWRESHLLMDRVRGLKYDDSNYKIAIMRIESMVYYFFDDILVYKDITPYVWERTDGGVASPAIFDIYGGASKLDGLYLLTDKTEIQQKLVDLNTYEKKKDIPNKVKVVLASGQSNCEGVTRSKDLTESQINQYNIDYTNVAIDYYAYSTMNTSNHEFVNVCFGQGLDHCYFGYEIGMSYSFLNKDPDNFYAIIKYSRGDSDIYANFRSPSAGKQVGYLYTGLVNYVHESLTNLTNMGVEFEIVGMCWMQGERDGSMNVMSKEYLSNLRCLYNDLCGEFDQYCEGGKLKFFDATIKDYGGTYPNWEDINNAKYQLESEYDSYHVIETNSQGLDLKTLTYDWNHYDPTSELKLGRAFGDEILKYTNK